MPTACLRRASAVAAALTSFFLCISTPVSGQRPRTVAEAGPRLIVLLVVDQMRADYVDRFQADWTGGLKRLLTQGARFTNAAYPYLGTYTCAGHATISTGTFPYVHGIFQNTWFDRQRGDNIPCTRDGVAKAVTYSGNGGDDGPGLLRVPTLADALRAQRGARVVSASLKARSAIMMAGHAGGTVTWMTENGDGWQTADTYSAAPVPMVKAYLDAHPYESDHGTVWHRLLPASRYREADDAADEAPPRGWTRTFPHPIVGETNTPDRRFHDLWQRSPWADAYLGQMAASLAESARLGTGETTDLLAVSFSSPDLLAHQFGPHSQEVRDLYARLDRTVGQLLARLDALVGSGRYVVALTADHGVADIPEQALARGTQAGRLSALELRDAIERTVAAILGPGQYVARVNTSDVYFRPGVYEALQQRPGAVARLVAMLEERPGVARVLRGSQVMGQTTSADPLIRAAAFSYVPDRSGDLLIIVRPGWVFYATGTTHGSANPADQRVPMVFMGPGIRPGTYGTAVTPADIAPTLASLVGIELPKAQGRPLRMAMRPAPEPSTK